MAVTILNIAKLGINLALDIISAIKKITAENLIPSENVCLISERT